MLSLTVREGDYITIGEDVVVQVLKAGDTFRIAINAPRSMAIERAKVYEQTRDVPECIRRVQRKAPLPASAQKRQGTPIRDA